MGEHIVELLTASSRAVFLDQLCFICGHDLADNFDWQQYVYNPGEFTGLGDLAGWTSEIVASWKPASQWISQMQGDIDETDVHSFANHMSLQEVLAARHAGQQLFCQNLKQHYQGKLLQIEQSKVQLEVDLQKTKYQLREARKLS